MFVMLTLSERKAYVKAFNAKKSRITTITF